MAKYLIGIDEVGRGPLAGPITIGVVVVPQKRKNLFVGIKDSKALSVSKREEWFKALQGHTRGNRMFYAISSVSHAVIDKIGIVPATRLAISRSLKKIAKKNVRIGSKSARVLLDGGLKAPREYANQQTIIRGDKQIPIIAAASIMAKVMRDRKMMRLAREYPQYGFDIHKGYGTKAHMRALKKYGLSNIHRKSFCGRFI
ncbi:MAG: ribonuclease HII [Candidatus Niyogibacteria bacterium CG10_big_fil_rev_8_21_14_0_10_46_36]|uniref:Ribonuclease HII n=1 Tax=Candidatus Niyogibacteria bacterium CG10_big_fil_rev_8_21_14_0_10_46_36 TaxID=1974726 RepID=A0A2H0TET1_9BACT|nr:MAG: ribonuclease HII [Candidatus Niyogibacteria bacterium CG10_big_fil_rev_8_21_14_0_10_46_36]